MSAFRQRGERRVHGNGAATLNVTHLRFGWNDSGCLYLSWRVAGSLTSPTVLPPGNSEVDPVMTDKTVAWSVHAAFAIPTVSNTKAADAKR